MYKTDTVLFVFTISSGTVFLYIGDFFMKYLNGSKTTYIETKKVDYKGLRDVPVIKFIPFKNIEWITHGFSTRLGGVSTGIYSSMNLNFVVGDEKQKVIDNHIIMAKSLGVEAENCVFSKQVHKTDILKVKKEHCGMGVVREREFDEIDGLITNEKGIMLVTSYADCVPLYFVDTKNKAIGLSHSGWRGTYDNIAKETLKRMKEEYHTESKDVITFIGPSICKNCYEVSKDLAEQFDEKYKGFNVSLYNQNKYFLDLHMANKANLLRENVPEENIHTTDICTCCNSELLFSHRASRGKRGGLCGYLMISN